MSEQEEFEVFSGLAVAQLRSAISWTILHGSAGVGKCSTAGPSLVVIGLALALPGLHCFPHRKLDPTLAGPHTLSR